MNRTIKYLLATVAISPALYVLVHDHLKKPHSTTHCFYCRHTGKILVGSLAPALGLAFYFTKDLTDNKNN